MNRTVMKGAGIGLLLSGLMACDPPLSYVPGITLNLTSPTEGQEAVALNGTATVEFSADGMSLAAPGCDPSKLDITRYYDGDGYLAGVEVLPGWTPYDNDCTDADGNPANPDQVNLQLYVDGIFMGIHTDTNIPLDLMPKGDDTDIRFAQYDDYYANVLCYYYFPNDNLDYAGQMFREVAIPVGSDLFGMDFDADQNGIPDVPLPVEALAYFPLYLMTDAPYQWTYFDYSGIYENSDTLNFIENHIFYVQLHYGNNSVVSGAPRNRVITGQLDLNQMPADWCGFNPVI